MKFIKLYYKYCLVVIATLLLYSNDVIASTITKNINIAYDNIKLVIDGKEIIPKDPNGEVVEPFVYNGTTYLPLRACSDALTNGTKSVTWDGNNSTIYIGKDYSGKKVVPMSQLKADGYLGNFSKKTLYNRQNTIVSDSATCALSNEYYLDSKYITLNANFACYDEENINRKSTVKFINPYNNEVIAEYTSHPYDKPIDISVNISGLDRLQINIDGEASGCLYNATVIGI